MYPAQADAFPYLAPREDAGTPRVTLATALQWGACLFCLLTLTNG